MTRQLALALPVRAARGREDFLVAPSNAEALAALEDCRRWPAGRLALSGPAGAGKTHLMHVWAGATGAAMPMAEDLSPGDVPGLAARGCVALDDADRVAGRPEAERALLHLANALAEADGRLLLAARAPPARWGIGLPDLASRLAAAPVARIAPPDEALLAAVLVKLFEDRQLRVAPAAIEAILSRIERSAASARAAVALLDAAALSAGRAVTAPLVREVLDMQGTGPEETT
ncbi:MAG: chromosomal replication initiator DnaA [Rhodobacteraceae bacterium]|nr:chromosomal replication initiator DnaA [Paracoccaceae bacterium]